MRFGETIATYDVGLALRGKSGKFEVTSPAGEIYDVICRPSHSASSLEWCSDGNDHSPFFIRKVAEGASPADTKATPTGISDDESQTASSALPFMLEQAVGERHSLIVGNIELLYLEDNPQTGQPSACVYLTSDPQDHTYDGEPLMTSRCATFNELDSEIRRLQAQLDEIRCRAKKMFYKARAFAASA
jgi:hypothetical protein